MCCPGIDSRCHLLGFLIFSMYCFADVCTDHVYLMQKWLMIPELLEVLPLKMILCMLCDFPDCWFSTVWADEAIVPVLAAYRHVGHLWRFLFPSVFCMFSLGKNVKLLFLLYVPTMPVLLLPFGCYLPVFVESYGAVLPLLGTSGRKTVKPECFQCFHVFCPSRVGRIGKNPLLA